MTDGLFTAEREAPGYCPRCSFDPCACALLAEACPGCGVDPCACAQLGDEEAIAAQDFREIEAVAAIVKATPIRVEVPLLSPVEAHVADRLASWQSPALAAFIDRRAAIEAKHGAKAITDPTRPPSLMAHDLKERACALLDRLSGREPDAERAALALNTLATIGALALALHARLSGYVEGNACPEPVEGGPPSGGEEGGPRGSTLGESSGSTSLPAMLA